MVRKLANILLPLLFVLPSAAFALGLGDIKLRSALNQPMDADIELLSVTAAEADSLNVSLASYETFARIGLDRPAVLMFLKFAVADKNGRYVIHITSKEPIKEPFLNFLLEVSGRSGRLLREYTVLIDPPLMGAEKAPALQAPQAAAAPATSKAVAPAAAPTIVSGRPATPAMPAAAPVAGELRYGPVKADETLWSIATRMRPNKSITPQQMMMALLKANPEAFYDNNVNRLKMGYVLRIDDPAMITAMSHADAVREIRMQNRAWQDHSKQAAGAAQDRPATEASVQAARTVAAPDEARLKLVAPEGEAKKGKGTSTAASKASADQLKSELMLAQETAEAQRRENEELQKRMQELEGQLASMQRLLSLKDSDLASLQHQLRTEPGAPAPQEMPSAPVAETRTEPAASEPAAMPEGETAAPVEAATPSAEPATPAIPAEAPKPAPRPVAPPPMVAEEPGLLDDVMENPMMLGGLGVIGLALLALLGLIIKRRRAGGPGFSESILSAGGTSSILGAKSGSGVASEESSLFSDLAVSGMNSVQGGDSEVDPLTEADVYMAYGRYQQAEDLLKEAINKHGDRADLKVKMLEVYYSTKNRDAFEPMASEVFTALEGNGPLWGKVLVMGHELCPDNPMFSAAPEHPAYETSAGAGGTDDVLDIGIDLDALAEDMESGEGGGFDLDLGVDFSDLDDGRGKKQAAAEAEPAAMADADFDIGNLEPVAEAVAAPASTEEPEDALAGFDFNLSGPGEEPEQTEAEVEAVTEAEPAAKDENALDFDLGDFSFGAEKEVAESDAPQAEAPDELDMGGFNLDLGGGEAELAPAAEVAPSAGMDDFGDLDLGDLDAVGTKLDLAKAYIDMGDSDSARSILDEVLDEGDDAQKAQAKELLGQVG